MAIRPTTRRRTDAVSEPWYIASVEAVTYPPPNGPQVFVQWKGTDVCLDFTCECGISGHFDGFFAHALRCSCGAVWAMPSTVYPRKLTDAEIEAWPDASARVVDVDPDAAEPPACNVVYSSSGPASLDVSDVSGVPREVIIHARLENNLDDVVARGPRLSVNRSTWIVARCETGEHILRGGLGGMGVGEMWTNRTHRHTNADGSMTYDDDSDPTWPEAPIVERAGCPRCTGRGLT
jgi:hypothetical protein